MSVFKQKNSIASVEFKKFKGIDRKASHGDSSVAYDMSNFRILPDGSLMKREGFSPLSTTGSAYRGVWSGKLNGKVLTFVLQGATISKMYPEERSFTSIGKISTMTGTANFIPYNNRLYLYNQNAFYHITEDSVSIVDGYAPLYGKDWPSAKKGEVNEPLNLTSRHIRMTYIVDQNVPYLQVDHAISSIDAVYINNALVTDSSRYSLNRDMMYVSVSGLKINDRVSLFLTIDESELDKADLMSCKRTAAYGDYKDNILLFWDGNKKNTMFASCSIDNASLEEVTSVYPDTLPLYISANAIFKLPKQENYITAVCPQYDRLLNCQPLLKGRLKP